LIEQGSVPYDPIRLGVLVPSVNTVVEPEMYRMAPPGVTVHFSRLPVPSGACTADNLERLEDHLDESLHSLVQAEIKAVVFACTSGSFIRGPAWDRHLIARMEKIFIPATTASESVISALKALRVKNLALVTPYPEAINTALEAYLVSQGIEVVTLKSFGLSCSREIKQVPPQAVYEMAKSAHISRSEGILISCTDLRSISVIDRLEVETGKPVITSNQASLWRLMDLCGIRIPVKGFGRLFSLLEEKDEGRTV
jgi:maleate cis-trans isomerase